MIKNIVTMRNDKTLTIEDWRYPSTIDPEINNLYAKVCFNPRRKNLPILVVMHGSWGDVADFQDGMFIRMAKLGFFVVAFSMRWSDGSAGDHPDHSAHEIYDIYDGLQEVRSRYAGIVSPDKAVITGYSGGGGNVLGCAGKFPDTFCAYMDHFGISDYGHSLDGWYYVRPGGGDSVVTAVGGTPAEIPNNYYSRAHYLSVNNANGAFIYLFHDVDDATVPLKMTTIVKDVLDQANNDNYLYSVTDADSVYRWTHNNPQPGTSTSRTEDIWARPCIVKHQPWTIPISGSLKVMGYIVTKRFSIWMNDGYDAVVDLVYDTEAGTYIVTPLTTGSITIEITQGSLSVSATITEQTTLTVT